MNLPITYHKLEQFCLKHFLPESFEIIVVDDGSTDQTPELTNTLQDSATYVRLIRHSTNLGIGQALKSGYRAAKHTFVCAIPADGQFNIDELENIPFEKLHNQLCVSFYRTNNTIYGPLRRLLTLMNNALLKKYYRVPLRDVNWIKLYPTCHLNTKEWICESSFLESEICIRLTQKNVHFEEIESTYCARSNGRSKAVTLKSLSMVCKDTIKVFWRLPK